MKSKKSKLRDPRTPAEWQMIVDLAEFMLYLDSAIQYGLMTGPAVDADRCRDLLFRGAKMGIHPAPDAVERIGRKLAAEALDQ